MHCVVSCPALRDDLMIEKGCSAGAGYIIQIYPDI